jgi:hypothetical protein
MLNRFIVELISLGDIAYGFLHPRPLVLVPTALTHHPCFLVHILSIENEKYHLFYFSLCLNLLYSSTVSQRGANRVFKIFYFIILLKFNINYMFWIVLM